MIWTSSFDSIGVVCREYHLVPGYWSICWWCCFPDYILFSTICLHSLSGYVTMVKTRWWVSAAWGVTLADTLPGWGVTEGCQSVAPWLIGSLASPFYFNHTRADALAMVDLTKDTVVWGGMDGMVAATVLVWYFNVTFSSASLGCRGGVLVWWWQSGHC